MSGYLALAKGRYDVNSFHPPLAKLVAVAPLLWYRPSLDEGWLDEVRPTTPTVELASEWFWANERDPQTMLRMTRTSVQVFHALLVGFILYLMLGIGGTQATGLLFILAFLSPPFLGLSAYTVTDATNVLFMLCALLMFSLVASPTPNRAKMPVFTLFLFAGMSTKHSFLILPVSFLVGCAVLCVFQKLKRQDEWKETARLFLRISVATFVAFLSTMLCYSFCMRGMDPQTVSASIERSLKYQPYLALAVDTPALHSFGIYMNGLGRTAWLIETGGTITTSFLSQSYQGGRSLYFPIILLVKENPLVLLTLLWGVALTLYRLKNGARPPNTVLVVTAAAVSLCYFGIALNASLNIGFRHLLPTYLCALLAASLLPVLWNRKILLALLVARLLSLALSYPHYLGYFNVLAGGVEGGYQVSVICDADWSQDFLRLRHFVEERGGQKVFVYAASSLDPGYYLGPYLKTEHEEFQSGDLVAISTTFLEIPSYLRGDWKERVEQAKSFPRVGQIGGSIVIFSVP
jgi:hypothetical protein